MIILPRYLSVVLVLLLFCFTSSRLEAEQEKNAALSVLLAEIEARSTEVKSLSCDFTQERHLTMFSRPVIFHGRLALDRPDRLRWEFIDPIPSVLIFNQDHGLRCSGKAAPQSFDLATDPIMAMVAKQLWTWLDGDYSQLANSYRLELAGENTLSITPEDLTMQKFVEKITIIFSPGNKHPHQVDIREPDGDLTRILFSNYRLNPLLYSATFTSCDPS